MWPLLQGWLGSREDTLLRSARSTWLGIGGGLKGPGGPPPETSFKIPMLFSGHLKETWISFFSLHVCLYVALLFLKMFMMWSSLIMNYY